MHRSSAAILRPHCAVLNDGGLRCWGYALGTGYATQDPKIGDDEFPFEMGDVPTGGKVVQVATGADFTCALYQEGNVRCWGYNAYGQLGYGDTQNRYGKDGFTPDILPDVDLGGTATQLTAGGTFMCALMDTGNVRCWGQNTFYQLATQDQNNVGDNETPASRGAVVLGAKAVAVSAGGRHACALLESGSVRCWGSPSYGPLGYGNTNVVGDNETPAQAGSINVGGAVVAISAGGNHTCALLSQGRVRCWGRGGNQGFPVGLLGYKETQDIGDNETPASAGNIALGGTATTISTMWSGRCALLSTGAVRCWGKNPSGSLGYGDLNDVGDNETPAQKGDLHLGGAAVKLANAASTYHMCAIMEDGGVKCWGLNGDGQLGLGTTDNVGDNERPDALPEVRVLQ